MRVPRIVSVVVAVGGLTLLLASARAGAYDYQDYDWRTWGGHQYALTFASGGWTAAEREAQALGAHLVTVNGSPENTWLCNTAFSYAETGWARLWIGYNAVESDDPTGPYEWIGEQEDPGMHWDGSGYTNWAIWEPSDNPGELYVEMCTITQGYLGRCEWNNAPDGFDPINQHPGIIEIPEPGALCLLAVGALAVVRRRTGR